MRKISSYFVILLFSVIGFTSCLDGNNESTGAVIGVLDYSSGTSGLTCVLKTDDVNYYCPGLNSEFAAGNIAIGDCLYLYFTIDYDLPENTTSMIEANGFATVTMNGYVKFDKYYTNSFLSDTTSVWFDEIPVVGAYTTEGIFGFYDNYMFITHVINQPENIELSWDLSYDAETMMPTEVDGVRYYDLYLRATKANTSTGTSKQRGYGVAYYMGYFMQTAATREKAALGSAYDAYSSAFKVRIHYVSEIKNETEFVWSTQEINLSVAAFLSQ